MSLSRFSLARVYPIGLSLSRRLPKCLSFTLPLSLRFALGLSALSLLPVISGCVVKEELDDTYNQAHLGLNEWELKLTDNGLYALSFEAGYLIGLIDDEGVEAINWRYELITRDREPLGSFSEEMRPASPDRVQVFVEGKRSRVLELSSLLSEGETYVLWFTLYYEDEILHEQLFPVVAGGEGGDPYWIEELVGDRLGDDSSDLIEGADGSESEGVTEGPESVGESESESEESSDITPLPEPSEDQGGEGDEGDEGDG